MGELIIQYCTMKSTVSVLIVCCLGLGTAWGGQCDPSYSPVGNKCYSVPGLPIQLNFWWASETCSSLYGDLFHVETIGEWHQLNDFLINTLGYTDTYWTGISSQGHPGTWVTRSTGEELDPAAVEFKKGSPSNSDDKLCLAIEYQKDLGRYQFVDYPCSNEYVIMRSQILPLNVFPVPQF